MTQLTYGSLFSGIGGIDLGLDRAGMHCKWQVEIDEYASKVLAKHWPNVARYGDIRECGAHNLESVDLICGGFPCQDISNAGKRAGIEGERSGLWKEFYRVICELQPQYVLVENVSALLHRGIERVLGDLAACGYDAEWQVLPASAFGAPHKRDRVFIVAYSNGLRCNDRSDYRQRGYVQRDRQRDNQKIHQIRQELQFEPGTPCEDMADPTGDRRQPRGAECQGQQGQILPEWSGTSLADTSGTRLQGGRQERKLSYSTPVSPAIFERRGSTRPQWSDWWAIEPNVGRVVNGVSHRVDRLRGLGNAVVPQVAEYIGRCILAAIEAEEVAVS